MDFRYDKDLSKQIYSMYISEKIGFNSLCLACKATAKKKNKELINGGVPFFHVGIEYAQQEKRLLLIGTVAYGWEDLYEELGYNNFQELWENILQGKLDLSEKMQDIIARGTYHHLTAGKDKVKYLQRIADALRLIYGNFQTGYDKIAITNFVHCNSSNRGKEKGDNLPQKTRDYCISIDKNGFIFKEIEILNPTHVICLSSDWKYRKFLHNYLNKKWKYKEIKHPSSPGHAKSELIKEIRNFLNE